MTTIMQNSLGLSKRVPRSKQNKSIINPSMQISSPTARVDTLVLRSRSTVAAKADRVDSFIVDIVVSVGGGVKLL